MEESFLAGHMMVVEHRIQHIIGWAGDSVVLKATEICQTFKLSRRQRLKVVCNNAEIEDAYPSLGQSTLAGGIHASFTDSMQIRANMEKGHIGNSTNVTISSTIKLYFQSQLRTLISRGVMGYRTLCF